MAIQGNGELNEIINKINYQLKAIIHKLNIKYQYIDSDDLYQEAILYLWQQYNTGKLKKRIKSITLHVYTNSLELPYYPLCMSWKTPVERSGRIMGILINYIYRLYATLEAIISKNQIANNNLKNG